MAAKEENIYDGVIRTYNGKRYIFKPWSFTRCTVNFQIMSEVFAELKKIEGFSIAEVLNNLDVVLRTAPKAVSDLLANTALDEKGKDAPDINDNIRLADAVELLALVINQNFFDPALGENLKQLVGVFQSLQNEKAPA